MDHENKSSNSFLAPGMLKKYWLVMFATFSNTAFLIQQLSQVFYVQFQSIFRLTNTQMGFLEGLGSIGGFIGGFIGGMLSDRYSPKKLTAMGCFVAAFAAALESVAHSYLLLIVIYFCLAMSGNVLLMTPYFKMLKLLGTSEEQGKIMTFSETAYAIVTLVIQYGFLGAITALNLSFQIALRGISIVCIIVGIGILFYFNSPGLTEEEKRLKEVRRTRKGAKKQEKTEPEAGLLQILKMPVTWCNAIATVTMTMMSQVIFIYMNPYLVGVMAFTAGAASLAAITMKNFFRIVISPIGGTIRDKLGDSTIIVRVICAALVAVALGLALLPTGGGTLIVYFVLIALAAIGIFTITGLQYTLVEDAKVPVKYTGRLWGVVFAVNAAASLIRGGICGQILDRMGTEGYHYIFLFLACIAALCGMAAWVLHRLIISGKALGREVQAEVNAMAKNV